METNYTMVLGLKDYRPARRGFTSLEEEGRIYEHFGLGEMTRLELENLRDTVDLLYMIWLNLEDDYFRRRDLMDAADSITSVINSALSTRD
jgi:hypothetical protein